MGKGDKKTKRGKITQGSYGKTRPKKSASVKAVPVKVLDEDEKKVPKAKVKKELDEATEPTENAEVTKKPKAVKAETAEEKPKTTRKKKESVSQLKETDFFLRELLIFERKICLKVAF